METRRPTHEQIIDLLPAYALNCLDSAEEEEVRAHLATCPACRSELASYEHVADQLAFAAPEVAPAPALREQLMAQVRQPETAAPIGTAVSPARPSFWHQIAQGTRAFFAGPRWRLAALLLIIVLLVGNVVLWQQRNDLPANFQERVLTGTALVPEATGLMIISHDGRHGTLVVDGLPPLDEELAYQLWLIKDGERTSGGVFSVSEDGYASLWIGAPEPLQDYGAFGVTIEPAGGSPGPTGERVLGFNL